MRARIATLILAAASLGGCAYGPGLGGLSVGASYGNPYGSYGSYGGYGGRYGYGSPYGYGGYGGYNPYYGSPFGWYDGYYYPGSGRYVYDRDRKRREMTEAQRRHWMQRIADAAAAAAKNGQTTGQATTQSRSSTRLAPNWSAFKRESASRTPRTSVRSSQVERVQARAEARQERRAVRVTRVEPADPRSTRSIRHDD